MMGNGRGGYPWVPTAREPDLSCEIQVTEKTDRKRHKPVTPRMNTLEFRKQNDVFFYTYLLVDGGSVKNKTRYKSVNTFFFLIFLFHTYLLVDSDSLK